MMSAERLSKLLTWNIRSSLNPTSNGNQNWTHSVQSFADGLRARSKIMMPRAKRHKDI
jgi:hypothetical protein